MDKSAAVESANDAGAKNNEDSAEQKQKGVKVEGPDKKLKGRNVYKGDLSKLDKNARRELFRQNIYPYSKKLNRKDYEAFKFELQIELLKMQNWVRETGERILILNEGRDAAGKGGTIKRIMEHLNPRGARVVALEKPTSQEKGQWYFQRYIQHLPSAGEIVLFDRSWYNRAGVERVMGFCDPAAYLEFMRQCPEIERMLVRSGIMLFKYWSSVTQEEQRKRFEARKTDPLKQYKISPVDKQAQALWDQYTVKKFQMLSESNRTIAPWTIIRSDNKKRARINTMKYLLTKMDYAGKIPKKELEWDPEIIVSGIDELKHMEENLLKPGDLPG